MGNFRIAFVVSFAAVLLAADLEARGPRSAPPAARQVNQEKEIEELLPSVEDAPGRPGAPATSPNLPPPRNARPKGVDDVEFVDIKAAPPLVRSEDSRIPTEGGLLGAYNDSNLLLLGLRTDTSYFAGSTVQQGFALSSARLTAWGSSGGHISYRFSLGQTREFSSVQMPQIMPVEAWVDVHTASRADWSAKSRLNWRVGMFAPTFNPWWSPDLADMQMMLPDYSDSHRLLFLSRELGTELTIEPISDRLSLTVGAFNGTGILASNTNAAKAFTFSVQGKIPLWESKLWLGVSGYLMDQADATSISFKSNGIWNLYLAWEYPAWKTWIAAEVFGGELNDSTRSSYPIGASLMAQFRVLRGLRLFSRVEGVRNTGRGGNGRMASVQVGPVLDFHRTVQLFMLYDHRELEDGTNENFGNIRLRLQL